jgi:hypothetical protein
MHRVYVHLRTLTEYGLSDTTPEQTMQVLSCLALDRATQKKASARGRIPTRAQNRPMRNRLVRRGRCWAIKTSPRMARGH